MGTAMAKRSKVDQPPESPDASDSISWQPADKGYGLALIDGKLACRNPKGKTLATLPPWIKESELAQQLLALSEWLDEHALECLHTVERWMLRSLAVPREVLHQIWPDPDWRKVVENIVVAPANAKGESDLEQMGLLKNVDAKKGLGVVDVDGESQWLKQPLVIFPHPILIGALDDLRELANDLNLEQAIEQLYRPVYQVSDKQRELRAIRDFEGGKFEQLNFAIGACRRLGYPVRGGYATCRVWEGKAPLEARYFVGGEFPEAETETGELLFVGGDQQAVAMRDVGPVTFSEGMRMAAAIYAKRQVEEKSE